MVLREADKGCGRSHRASETWMKLVYVRASSLTWLLFLPPLVLCESIITRAVWFNLESNAINKNGYTMVQIDHNTTFSDIFFTNISSPSYCPFTLLQIYISHPSTHPQSHKHAFCIALPIHTLTNIHSPPFCQFALTNIPSPSFCLFTLLKV